MEVFCVYARFYTSELAGDLGLTREILTLISTEPADMNYATGTNPLTLNHPNTTDTGNNDIPGTGLFVFTPDSTLHQAGLDIRAHLPVCPVKPPLRQVNHRIVFPQYMYAAGNG